MTTPCLSGKSALITGAARRVGEAIALHLAEHGMDVAITCNQSLPDARRVAAKIEAMGRRALVIQADLAAPDAAARVHDQYTAAFDRLDALVNNAAVYERQPMGSITTERFDRDLAVNARAPLMLTQVFAVMLAVNHHPAGPPDPGRVINLLDAHVPDRPRRGYTAYLASKAALHQITLSLARELAPDITVNAIAPGVVAWPPDTTDEEKTDYLKRVPLARAGTPEDVAAAALYLIRDAPYCTGQVIQLDGGRHLA